MQEVFNDGRIRIIHGDNMEGMKLMTDKQYSLSIVDPPYGIRVMNSGGKGISGWKKHQCKEWDNERPTNEYFQELFRVSTNQIIWGGNYFTQNLPPSMGWIVWDKIQHNFSCSDGELAFSSFNKKLRVFERYTAVDNGFQNKDFGGIHPTEKPVALYKWLLKNYAKPGDTILDTHGGSLSLALACHDMGFDCTIFEIDKDYIEAGVKRLKQHQQQLAIFDLGC